MQFAAEKELNQLKLKPSLPKLSLRFVAFTDREVSSFSRNGSFSLGGNQLLLIIILVMTQRGKKVFQTKLNDMGGVFL